MQKRESIAAACFVATVFMSNGAHSKDNVDEELRPPAPFIRESTFNQNPGSGKLEGKLLRVKRPLLIVKDLGRSLDFYVDVIGLEIYSVEPTYNRDPASLGAAIRASPKPASRSTGDAQGPREPCRRPSRRLRGPRAT